MRRKPTQSEQRFERVKQELIKLGWRVSISPEPMLRGLGLAEWIFRKREDLLDFLFVGEDDLAWSRARFDREPFGDFTNCCVRKGAGTGEESLLTGAKL